MDRARAQEILAAYGADSACWPEGERAALTALLAADADLRAEAETAAALDRMLGVWAVPLASDDLAATRAADAALAALPAPRRWWPTAALGGSVAAALGAGALLLTPAQVAEAPAPAPVQIAAADHVSYDAAVTALVFTPTPEEESLI